jgi:hypothetical protein
MFRNPIAIIKQCAISQSLRMNFEEFRQRARLYVLGALEISEIAEFEASTTDSAKKPQIASGNVLPCTRPWRSVCDQQNHQPS